MYGSYDLMRDTLARSVLDSANCKGGKCAGKKGRRTPEEQEAFLDAVAKKAAQYSADTINLQAAASVEQWLEDDDLDDGEGFADRLKALAIGVADVNNDEQITEDEADVIDATLESMGEYLASKGVAEDDIDSLLNEWDESAASRVRDYLMSEMPDDNGDVSDIDQFAFGADDGSQEALLDAAYKTKMVVRNGKVKRVRKRVSGTVYRTAKQKAATKKAARRSHSASANVKRKKSMRVRGQRFGK